MPVATEAAPVPSRSTATSTSVSLVVRLIEPLRMGEPVASENAWALYQGFAKYATAATFRTRRPKRQRALCIAAPRYLNERPPRGSPDANVIQSFRSECHLARHDDPDRP